MSVVVFDIETLGFDFATFDEAQQEYLMKFADTDEKRQAELLKLNLSALTARIIAIGMLNPETMGGKVFYQSTESERFTSDDGKVEYLSGDERFVLQSFWESVDRYDRIVTFNGRAFDGPFIMLRSAMLGIPAGRNLVGYRFDATRHCDLLDQLTFYGATRKFNLDFYCKAFGIKSPKSDGITGLDLGPLFREGKFREIASYCLGDIVATSELYKRWASFISIKE